MVKRDIYGIDQNNILGINPYGNNSKKKPERQPIKVSQKNIVWDRQKGKCVLCGCRLERSSTHYDHIKEVSKNGKSTTDNLRAICANCHYRRHNEDKALKADKKNKNGNRGKKNVYMFENPIIKNSKFNFGI